MATQRKSKPKGKPAAAPAEQSKLSGKYIQAIGRRKESTAVVRAWPTHKETSFTVNGKTLNEYFPLPAYQYLIRRAIEQTGSQELTISARVTGGGLRGQADSLRLGLARVLLLITPDTRKVLRSSGLLTRDARVKERKKYGLKGARRAPQWQKR